jgi:DNA-binding transcriptional LysR family regulator
MASEDLNVLAALAVVADARSFTRAASPPFPGYFLYYVTRRQQPRALAALVDTLRV